jgi:hypothetical protein
MKSFSSTVQIAAAPETVWDTVVDTASWPQLDSSIASVEGTPAPGAKITVRVKAGRAFPLRVVELAAPTRMTLVGGMPLGLFAGRRTYALTPDPSGTVELSVREEYSGLLAPLIVKSIPDLQPSFGEFTASVKRRVEASA